MAEEIPIICVVIDVRIENGPLISGAIVISTQSEKKFLEGTLIAYFEAYRFGESSTAFPKSSASDFGIYEEGNSDDEDCEQDDENRPRQSWPVSSIWDDVRIRVHILYPHHSNALRLDKLRSACGTTCPKAPNYGHRPRVVALTGTKRGSSSM